MHGGHTIKEGEEEGKKNRPYLSCKMTSGVSNAFIRSRKGRGSLSEGEKKNASNRGKKTAIFLSLKGGGGGVHFASLGRVFLCWEKRRGREKKTSTWRGRSRDHKQLIGLLKEEMRRKAP